MSGTYSKQGICQINDVLRPANWSIFRVGIRNSPEDYSWTTNKLNYLIFKSSSNISTQLMIYGLSAERYNLD